jgi:hypothetical protein
MAGFADAGNDNPSAALEKCAGGGQKCSAETRFKRTDGRGFRREYVPSEFEHALGLDADSGHRLGCSDRRGHAGKYSPTPPGAAPALCYIRVRTSVR